MLGTLINTLAPPLFRGKLILKAASRYWGSSFIRLNSLFQWREKESSFKSALVDDINMHCEDNPKQCGIIIGWFPENE